MVLPHPESDLSMNLMVLGTDILKFLKGQKNQFTLIENVLSDFLKRDSRRNVDMFLNALSFLFCFGLVEQRDYKVRLVPQRKIPQQGKLFE